jgi:Tfp pilus assembly protein PilF
MRPAALLCLVGALGVACGGSKAPTSTGPSVAPTAGADSTASSAGAPSDTAPPQPEVQRGINALNDGQLPTARSLFEIAVQKNPQDAEATYYLGLANEKMGDKAAAENFYKAALKLKPDLENAAVNLSAMYADAKRFDEAIKVCKAALDKRPDSAPLHFNLGVALAETKDETGATVEFEAAIKGGPDEAMYRYTYGHWLGAWGKPDKAAPVLRAALMRVKETQDNVGLFAGIGHDLLVLRQTADCIAAFDKAIGLKDAAPLRTERALCKMAAKDEQGSEDDLRAAIAADPGYALAHYWLGVRLAKVKKPKEAIGEFQTYLKIEPNGAWAQKAQDHVATLKKLK